MRSKRLFLVGILAAACSSTPTNFAGTYGVSLLDGANACNFQGWTPGNSSGLTATITQDGSVAQFTVPSSTPTGLFLVLVLGTSTFSGTVTGNEFTATYLGTKQTTQQGTACTYTVNTKLDATIDGKNNLTGTLTFTPVTNSDPSCGALNSCANTATVTGVRTGP